MHQLSLTGSTLLKTLSSLTDNVFNNQENLNGLIDRSSERRDGRIPDAVGYSTEYLEQALKFPVVDYAYPMAKLGLDTSINSPRESKFWQDVARPHLLKIQNFIGSPNNALCMFYPSEGYIGWHHNGNAPGWNFILTYSMDGDGYFKYYNQHTEEYVTLQDEPGWNFRFGYYPNQGAEPENVFWHCAYTKKPRCTIGFIVPNKYVWESIVEECINKDDVPFDISKVGPKK